jgi:hypothetical protein
MEISAAKLIERKSGAFARVEQPGVQTCILVDANRAVRAVIGSDELEPAALLTGVEVFLCKKMPPRKNPEVNEALAAVTRLPFVRLTTSSLGNPSRMWSGAGRPSAKRDA